MWVYTLLPIILNMSLTASMVILFVLVARLLLKKAPKIFSYVLWAVVLFRLVCSVSFSSQFSLTGIFHTHETIDHRITYIPKDIVHMENPKVDLPISIANEIINDALPQGEEQLVADPLEAPMALATGVWIMGMIAMWVYSGISLMKLRKNLIGAVHMRENIYLVDHIETPFVYGVIRPKIFLPSSLTEKEQEYIILHEKTHIRGLDHIFKMIGFLVLTVHWFNPLVWVAFVCFVKDMEMTCDEKVLRITGVSIKRAYSTSLLSLATGRRIINGSPLAFGEGDIKGRIKNIMNFKKPRIWIIGVSVILVVVLSIGLATNGLKKIELPQADSILSMELEQVVDGESKGSVVITDQVEINDILYAISDAVQISAKTEMPNDDYVMVRFNLTNEQRTLYFYKTDDNYLMDVDTGTYRAKGKANYINAVCSARIQDNAQVNELLNRINIGMHINEVHEILGQPHGGLSGLKGDIYIMNGQTVTGIYYDSDNRVERIGSFDRPGFLEGNPMTIDDVKQLAKKGDNLVFEDFKGFKGANVSSSFDIYIMVYSVEEGYRLIVQAGVEGGKPRCADLESIWRGSGTGIDIRYDDIDEFLESNPPSTNSKRFLTKADVEPGTGQESLYLEKFQEEAPSTTRVVLLVLNQKGDEIWKQDFFKAHAGWSSLFLYETDGQQYLLRYNPYISQGYASYTYSVFTLQNGKEKVFQSKTIDFDILGLTPLDVTEMTAFADEINDLLSKSVLLFSSEGGEFTFGLSSSEKFYERYSWLDTYPKLYSDNDSLTDRLRKYRDHVLEIQKLEKEELYELTEEEIEQAKDTVMKYYESSVFKDRVKDVAYITDVTIYQSSVIPNKVKDKVIAFYVTMDDRAKRVIVLTKETKGEWQVINEGV
ncbi:MAG TPA: hypothetical protein DDZ89_15275 [Clostridiales bacterium]|nr:hypothetical protein [Clostridiales bacterium]